MPDTKNRTPLDGLSLTELQQRLSQVDAEISHRRDEELKVIADGYAKKLVANGFSIKEGMEALKPYLPRNMRPMQH